MSTTIKQAIDGFLLSCKVEGKSDGTIDCYSDTAFLMKQVMDETLESVEKRAKEAKLIRQRPS